MKYIKCLQYGRKNALVIIPGPQFVLVHLTERVYLNSSGRFTDFLMLRPGQHGAVSATEGHGQTSAAPMFSSLGTARVGALSISLSQPCRHRASRTTNLLQESLLRPRLILNVTQDCLNVEVA